MLVKPWVLSALRIFVLVLVPCLTAGSALAPAIADAPATADIPPKVRAGIESALQAKVAEILAERDDQGLAYKRANYSAIFHRIDDSTYNVGLHVDKAVGPDLIAERYLTTVKLGPDGTWSVVDQQLQDTYIGLHRGKLDDEEFMGFDGFSFEGEGLKVTAGRGSLVKDFYAGNVSRFLLFAPDLKYEYTPPVPKERTTHALLRKEREGDLVFDPDYIHVECDPTSCEKLLSTRFTGLKKIDSSEADSRLRDVYEESRKDFEKNVKDNPFFAFRRPYDPDRRAYSISIRKKMPVDHYFWLGYDSFDPKEISVGATGYGRLFYYYSDATLKSGVTPDDLDGRPNSDARDYDLISLKGAVEMGFGDGETLVGDITYGLETKRALREIPFGISRIFQTEEKKERKNPKMTINALQDGEGNELTWVRTGLYQGLVVLPAEVPAGTMLTLRLEFVNKDSIYKVTPSYSYVDRGGWLPFVRFADMIHDFDLTVKVPSKYRTLGIGHKVSETKQDGVLTTRWVADSPVSFPTVIFGDYVDEVSSVKVKKADGTEVPVTIHVDRQSLADTVRAAEVEESRGEVTRLIAVYDLKVSRRKAKDFVDQAANALNLYNKVFGADYPYGKLDLVNDPLGGFYGQAPSSLIYLGNPDFWGKGAVAGGLEFGARLSTFQDSVVAHEVAHQWWGSMISNTNDENYWFVESLAEYSSALYTEAAYGRQKYLDHVEAWRREILENDLRASVQEGYTVWQGPGGFAPFRAALYAKGPYAFHIMRSTWGDEAFFKFLKTLVAELKGKEITTRQIQRVAEQSFGTKLDWFFDQWLRGVGLPEFTFKYSVRAAEDGSQVIEGQVEQRVMLKAATAVKEPIEGEVFKGIVPITVIGKSGTEYRKRVVVEGPTASFKFSVPEKPKEVVFNKYGEALAYDIKVVEAS